MIHRRSHAEVKR
jgi:hypothetical protein